VGIDSAFAIANTGLANIQAQLATLSQNVANASTPGYTQEVTTQTAVTANGAGLGVRTGPAMLDIDRVLQASVLQQNTIVSGLQTTQAALQPIDSVLGTPGSGNDIGSLLGKLQSGFSTLLADPSSQPQQSAVVAAASNLAQGINTLSNAYVTQAQAAQTDLQTAVKTLNTTLGSISQLNVQIANLKAAGQSTADAENQRNAAVTTLSSLLQISTVEQPNGMLQIFTPNGMTIPTDGGATFAINQGTPSTPIAYAPGGGMPDASNLTITLNGQPVTGHMAGGRIGADLTLLQHTLPTYQAELDEFAYGLTTRFAIQGLTLFTDGAGNVPSGGGAAAQTAYVGYAGSIQVNPAVTVNPALVRDGTDAITNSSYGISDFTPNPSGGPAGFTTLISRVLTGTFGTDGPPLATTGLGASGALTAPFAAPATLAAYAGNLVAAQSQQSATVSGDLSTQQALQTSLAAKLNSSSGVNMDTEMSRMLTLQSAYGVNAKIIATIQSMFEQLLQAIP
jgi:flagellar hook-associated protein 1 FlgK